MELRPYQEQAVEGLRASLRRGFRRPVLQAPTAGGKTHIAVAVIQGAVAKGKWVLFLAPRRELIYQASERLATHGIDHGVIMAGEPTNTFHRVQVASMDTLYVRGVKTDRIVMPPADVIIVDEAHLSITETRQQILSLYPDSVIIGLTATPARSDGRGLGEVYDDLVLSDSIDALTEQGWLVPLRYFEPSLPDLRKIKRDKWGDYQQKDLERRMDKPKLVGEIVDNWLRIAPDRKTVVFCSGVQHSIHVCEEFRRRGIRAEHLDGTTRLDERKAILQRVVSGETQVLCNVYVASYGLDIPTLDCAVLARPTRNITLYLQTIGRVMRIAEGKTDSIIIDHAGARHEHGFAEDPVPWTLDSKTDIREQKKQQQQERKEPKAITCKQCQHVFRSSRRCPRCGYEMIPAGKPIPIHAADLEEAQRSREKAATRRNRTHSWEQKSRFMGELIDYAHTKGYKHGWVAHQYRAYYGVWPNDRRVKNAPRAKTSETTLRWITSQNIRRAKRRVA